MKFSLHIEDFNKELKYNHLDAKVLRSDSTLETLMSFTHSFGNVTLKEIQLEIGSIFMSKYQLKNKLKLTGSIKEELVEMHFNFGNDIVLGENNSNKAVFSKMYHNLIGFNNISGFMDFSKGSSFNTFDIHIPITFVKKWAGKNKGLDGFLKEFENNRPAILYPQGMPITPAMQSIISQIINCPYKDISRSIFLECKVQELFCLQIEQTVNCLIDRNIIKFTSADIEKIHFAKSYIENNVSQQISIKKLSEISGINQQKLKEGFRHLFGTTVFGYAQEYRMIFAKQLLLDGLLPSEVYLKVGYSNLSSFSYAFKLFYGFSPGQIH